MSHPKPYDVAIEPADQAEVRELIAALDDYQASLYPPESHYRIGIEALSATNVRFAVARDTSGGAIGCGAVVLKPTFGELKRMFVRPAGRGQGVAKALLALLERETLRAGLTLLRLETGIHQPEALGLYPRCAYVRRGPFDGYPDDPLSVFMEKRLGD